jgi:hypothetical protein
MYTVMYGWRLAFVPLEPVVLLDTEIPVVAVLDVDAFACVLSGVPRAWLLSYPPLTELYVVRPA